MKRAILISLLCACWVFADVLAETRQLPALELHNSDHSGARLFGKLVFANGKTLLYQNNTAKPFGVWDELPKLYSDEDRIDCFKMVVKQREAGVLHTIEIQLHRFRDPQSWSASVRTTSTTPDQKKILKVTEEKFYPHR